MRLPDETDGVWFYVFWVSVCFAPAVLILLIF